jgi:hypothetical protein
VVNVVVLRDSPIEVITVDGPASGISLETCHGAVSEAFVKPKPAIPVGESQNSCAGGRKAAVSFIASGSNANNALEVITKLEVPVISAVSQLPLIQWCVFFCLSLLLFLLGFGNL